LKRENQAASKIHFARPVQSYSAPWWHSVSLLGFLLCLGVAVLNFPYLLAEIYYWVNPYSSSSTSRRTVYPHKPKVHLV